VAGIRRHIVAVIVFVCFCTSVIAADRTVEPIISRIPRHEVASRGLATVGYSKRLRALEIEFRKGGSYRYFDVPPAVYRQLQAADSKATFYNKNIRGKYRAVRVRAPRAAHGRK
jgi:hypothetical protein